MLILTPDIVIKRCLSVEKRKDVDLSFDDLNIDKEINESISVTKIPPLFWTVFGACIESLSFHNYLTEHHVSMEFNKLSKCASTSLSLPKICLDAIQAIIQINVGGATILFPVCNSTNIKDESSQLIFNELMNVLHRVMIQSRDHAVQLAICDVLKSIIKNCKSQPNAHQFLFIDQTIFDQQKIEVNGELPLENNLIHTSSQPLLLLIKVAMSVFFYHIPLLKAIQISGMKKRTDLFTYDDIMR